MPLVCWALCSSCDFKQSVWDLAVADYSECLIILPHLVLLTMPMSQLQSVYESLLTDYESMKRKREIKWEKTWRQNKKEDGEGKSDALAAHQHCLFQALFFYSSVLVPQSLHQEYLREERHQWGISPSRGVTQSFCIDSANVTNADCFLRFSWCKWCEKGLKLLKKNMTDFHQGITQSHNSHSADEKNISDFK